MLESYIISRANPESGGFAQEKAGWRPGRQHASESQVRGVGPVSGTGGSD